VETQAPSAAPAAPAAAVSGAPPEERAAAAAVSGAPPEERAAAAAEKGRELLLGMLERMGLNGDVEIVPQSDAEVDDDDRALVLNIVGDDLGALIGRQNETLSALEFVTRLMVNQQVRTRTSFVVDVNGYRAKRAESLRKLALRMADQVAETARTVALEPMPPAERRIIHLALRDHPKVGTQSVGEGDRRKVTLVPKK
jgi:spoIIIJ-associated protein